MFWLTSKDCVGVSAGTPLILGELTPDSFSRLFSCFLRQPAACASCMSTLQFTAYNSGQESAGRSDEDFWGTSLWWGDPPVARAMEQESGLLIQVQFGGGWCFQERAVCLHMWSWSPACWTFPYNKSLRALLHDCRGNKLLNTF